MGLLRDLIDRRDALTAKADAWLLARWPALVAAQNAYYANNGRYWQGLYTHANTIDHDEETDRDAKPTRASAKPTDQRDGPDWARFLSGIDNLNMPCRLRVDVYENTDGWGWVMIAEFAVTVKGQRRIFRRVRNGAGSADHRTHGWQMYDPQELESVT